MNIFLIKRYAKVFDSYMPAIPVSFVISLIMIAFN